MKEICEFKHQCRKNEAKLPRKCLNILSEQKSRDFRFWRQEAAVSKVDKLIDDIDEAKEEKKRYLIVDPVDFNEDFVVGVWSLLKRFLESLEVRVIPKKMAKELRKMSKYEI